MATEFRMPEQLAVTESERHLREIIDALPVAIYTTDADGRLTHFNRAAVEFSGRVPELGSDQWCVSWKLYYPDGTPMPHDQCPMALTLKTGRPLRGTEAIAERPDGTRIWFEPYPAPLRDSEGRVIGGINMLLNITERKLAEQRILVVDDNRDSADSLAMLLTTMGAEVRTAYNGAEAIKIGDEQKPEIVLLDIGMPTLNGFDACRQIRGMPWGRDALLVAMTGWGQAEDRQRTREAGFDLHLVKPVDTDSLANLLADGRAEKP